MGLLFALNGLYYSAAWAIANGKTKAENVSTITRATDEPIVKQFKSPKRVKKWVVCTCK